MAEWARIVNTTIKDYAHGFEDEVMRKRILLDRLKKLGNIEYNADGDGFAWQVKKSQRSLQTNNGAQVLTFAPTNTYAQPVLDYQGYAMTEAMTKREKLKNRKLPALIKVWDNIVKELFDDSHDRFSEELYIDSNATNNAGRVSGVETMFGVPTQSYDSTQTTTNVARTANAADPVWVPNVTYAGVSTVPGNSGGTWSGPWPYVGKGDAEYDYFSPLLINYDSTFFDGSSITWALNCVHAVRFLLTFGGRNKASEGRMNLVLMHTDLFRRYKDAKDSTERVVVNQGSKDREFGIDGDIFYQDGAEITTEFGIPTQSAYGFNLTQMKIKSMQDKLFDAEGPLYDIASRSWRVAVDFLGQILFKSPRNFGKLYNYT